MKKTALLLLTLMSLFQLSLKAQEQTLVIYEESNEAFDFRNFDNFDKMGLNLAQVVKLNNKVRSEKTIYTLQFAAGQSVFQFKEMLLPWLENSSDEKLKNFYKNQNQKKRIHTCFKDVSKQKLWMTGGSIPEDYMVEDDLTTLNKWELIDGDSIISGFQCKAARYIVKEKKKTDKDITAWYTMDIPISDGPKHYSGLPGLIVSIRQASGFILSISRIVKSDVNENPFESLKLRANKVTYKEKIDQFPPMMGF